MSRFVLNRDEVSLAASRLTGQQFTIERVGGFSHLMLLDMRQFALTFEPVHHS